MPPTLLGSTVAYTVDLAAKLDTPMCWPAISMRPFASMPSSRATAISSSFSSSGSISISARGLPAPLLISGFWAELAPPAAPGWPVAPAANCEAMLTVADFGVTSDESWRLRA